MTVTVHDFLQIAADLLENSKEIYVRASAGRAYYAAYHSCLPIQERLPHASGPAKGGHAELIKDLMDYFGSDHEVQVKIRSLGSILRSARDIRTLADYTIDQDFSKNNAEVILGLAQKIKQKAEVLNEAGSF